MSILQVDHVSAGYGELPVLFDVSMDIQEGEFVSVIGGNGAGKTTLLRTISGLLKPFQGEICFEDRVINNMPAERIVSLGVTQVPENRMLFPQMTVLENLEMGAFHVKDQSRKQKRLRKMFEIFPILKEREKQLAGTLSGGEQQILAITRGLMSGPKLLMLDEPSLGLAPTLAEHVFEVIQLVNRTLNVTVLLVEQDVAQSCQISDRVFVLENGRIALQGTGAEILENSHVRKAYLGL
jgi:branched-chain amino acid transport system ATP-binding protein